LGTFGLQPIRVEAKRHKKLPGSANVHPKTEGTEVPKLRHSLAQVENIASCVTRKVG
jgi:hypothetical protein